MEALFVIAVIASVIFVIYMLSRGRYFAITSWSKYQDELNYDPNKFYEDVQRKIEEKNIEGITIKTVQHSQGIRGFSAKRLYLEVNRNNLRILLCSAPFGTTNFFSYWLLEKVTAGQIGLSRIPIIGRLFAKGVRKITFFTKDTESVFLAVVEEAFKETMNEIFESKGMRKLQPEDYRPDFNNRFDSRISG